MAKWFIRGLSLALMLAALGGTALASPVAVPEIDPGSAASALALLSSGLLLITSRVRRS